MILFLNHRRENNLGDLYSSPQLYFDFGPGAVAADITEEMNSGELSRSADAIIYGGGTLAGRAQRHAVKPGTLKILWGGGVTTRGMLAAQPRGHNAKGFTLYGRRDSGFKEGEFVPCVSCMHPAFDRGYPVQHEVVYYGHSVYSPLEGRTPRMLNHGAPLRSVIELLGSAETVVTSSYHGMYWALLLGRKVVTIPFGSKFYQTPWPVQLLREVPPDPWRHGRSFDILKQCRDLNQKFYQRVLEVI
jgi:hypothetical protein